MIGDLFFVYNLICNKDGFGQNSLTRIFENLVSSRRGTSLINSYYDFVAELDKRLKSDRQSFIKIMQDKGSDYLEVAAVDVHGDDEKHHTHSEQHGVLKHRSHVTLAVSEFGRGAEHLDDAHHAQEEEDSPYNGVALHSAFWFLRFFCHICSLLLFRVNERVA